MISVYVYDHGQRIQTYRFQNEGFDTSFGQTVWIRGKIEGGEKQELTITGNPTVIIEKNVE